VHNAVRDALETLGVAYELLDCDPAFADTAAFCERYGFALEESANTIVVGSKKEPASYCACVVLATTRLDVNHKVCELLGVKKASFSPPETTKELTGMLIGGVTAFALPEGLPLYVDEGVMARERVVLGGGDRSSKVRLSPEVFRRMSGAHIVPGLAFQPVRPTE
jgi:prolyl-tRNA editing enzyme YbaK/EbsC (Cys-tRNA(Pro) deacylase)